MRPKNKQKHLSFPLSSDEKRKEGFGVSEGYAEEKGRAEGLREQEERTKHKGQIF